jgi:hypothetical protein
MGSGLPVSLGLGRAARARGAAAAARRGRTPARRTPARGAALGRGLGARLGVPARKHLSRPGGRPGPPLRARARAPGGRAAAPRAGTRAARALAAPSAREATRPRRDCPPHATRPENLGASASPPPPRRALELGLLGTLPGKTPDATMASALYTDIKKGKGRAGSYFVRCVGGTAHGLCGARAAAPRRPTRATAAPRAPRARQPRGRASRRRARRPHARREAVPRKSHVSRASLCSRSDAAGRLSAQPLRGPLRPARLGGGPLAVAPAVRGAQRCACALAALRLRATRLQWRRCRSFRLRVPLRAAR